MANQGALDAWYFPHGIINGIQNAIGVSPGLPTSIYNDPRKKLSGVRQSHR
jgi:hypothetical protein